MVPSPLKTILIITAYIAPFFFIPYAFKFAGGVLANLSGAVNNRNRGLLDRQRKFRGDSREGNQKRQDAGNRWKGGSRENWRGRMNLGLQGLSQAKHARPLSGGGIQGMRSRIRTARNEADDRAAAEAPQNTTMGAWAGDDAKVHAARYDNVERMEQELMYQDAGRFGENLQEINGQMVDVNARARADAIAQIQRTKRQMGDGAFHKARVRAQAKTGTGYIDPESGEFDASLMIDDINHAYGNDRGGAGAALAEMKSSLTNSGQVAGVAGFGTWAGQLDRVYNAQAQGVEEYATARQEAHETIMDNAIDSATPSQAIYGKPTSARAFGRAHTRRINSLVQSMNDGTTMRIGGVERVANERDIKQSLASAAGLHDAMASASPQNAREFADQVMGAGLVTSALNETTREALGLAAHQPGGATLRGAGPAGSLTYRQVMDSLAGVDQTFGEMRRDYSTAASASAAAAAAGVAPAASVDPTARPGGGDPFAHP